eukprot:4794474-Amphidinium_carterae.1
MAMKGFYLLGHGSLYQTFLDDSKPLLDRFPSAHAEAELSRGPWANAVAEFEVQEFMPLGSAPATPAAGRTPRRVQQQSSLAQRFRLHYVPQRFEFTSFADAARQVKLVGLARLTH